MIGAERKLGAGGRGQTNQFFLALSQGFPTWGRDPRGSRGLNKGVAKANGRIKINFFSIQEGKITNNKQKFKIIIMIMVWGSTILQYLDMGVAGQKGWETLAYPVYWPIWNLGLHDYRFLIVDISAPNQQVVAYKREKHNNATILRHFLIIIIIITHLKDD